MGEPLMRRSSRQGSFKFIRQGIDQCTAIYEGHLGSLIVQQTQAYKLIKIDCKDI